MAAMSAISVGVRGPSRRTARAARFSVEIFDDWETAAAAWDAPGFASYRTVFQDACWLRAWYGAFAGSAAEPMIAIIGDAATSAPVALLPLMRRRQRGVRIVEFADLELTDYNTPVLAGDAGRDPASANAMWKALRVALRRSPGGADLLRLRKMPLEIDGIANPLALLKAARGCSVNGNIVATGDDYDAYRHSLGRVVRKELERSWRVFTRDPAAAFQVVTARDEALRILSTIELQQGARMRDLGLNFVLNDGANAAFYRNLVQGGIAQGYAVVTVLTAGSEIVAALLGVRSGARYTMIRISNAGQRWSNCSPGRLIIERTMHALHRDGVRTFDFSIGNYSYKRRFGVAHVPLVNVTSALGARGLPYVLRDRAAHWLRQRPGLARHVRRLLGKPPSREEE
mgnify:FL=1